MTPPAWLARLLRKHRLELRTDADRDAAELIDDVHFALVEAGVTVGSLRHRIGVLVEQRNGAWNLATRYQEEGVDHRRRAAKAEHALDRLRELFAELDGPTDLPRFIEPLVPRRTGEPADDMPVARAA